MAQETQNCILCLIRDNVDGLVGLNPDAKHFSCIDFFKKIRVRVSDEYTEKSQEDPFDYLHHLYVAYMSALNNAKKSGALSASEQSITTK
jgi:hypothetical protein